MYRLALVFLLVGSCGSEKWSAPDSSPIKSDFQISEQTTSEAVIPVPSPVYAGQGEFCDIKTTCLPGLVCYPATPMKGICTQRCCEKGMEGFKCPPCPSGLSCWMEACVPL